MDAMRKPLLGLPSPILYLRAPSQRPGFASLSQTCGRLQASLLLCHKGMLVAQLEKESLSSCFRGVWDGGLCARKRKMHWHSGRKKGVPRCEMTASAQVSQAPNPDWSGSTAPSGTTLHPQTDGQSDVTSIKTLWDRYSSLVEFAYNNIVHTLTGKAPFEIVEGGKKMPPIMCTMIKIFEADHFVKGLVTSFAKIKEVLQKSQVRHKKAIDKCCRKMDSKEGDWVLLKLEKARLRKRSKK
ncbi:hypothetical protein L7F22_046146 [Adiantum nelumboides]|nr:hypothetical protein [Adiantum nelumboides]